jgi:protein KRI1
MLEVEDSESDQLPEDENGDLINEKVTSKFIETLAKLRYKHPDIYKVKQVFDEEDFDEPEND